LALEILHRQSCNSSNGWILTLLSYSIRSEHISSQLCYE